MATVDESIEVLGAETEAEPIDIEAELNHSHDIITEAKVEESTDVNTDTVVNDKVVTDADTVANGANSMIGLDEKFTVSNSNFNSNSNQIPENCSKRYIYSKHERLSSNVDPRADSGLTKLNSVKKSTRVKKSTSAVPKNCCGKIGYSASELDKKCMGAGTEPELGNGESESTESESYYRNIFKNTSFISADSELLSRENADIEPVEGVPRQNIWPLVAEFTQKSRDIDYKIIGSDEKWTKFYIALIEIGPLERTKI